MWVFKIFIHTWLILLFSKQVVCCEDTNTTMWCNVCAGCTDEQIENEKDTSYDGQDDWLYGCYDENKKIMYLPVCKITIVRNNYPHVWSKAPEYVEHVQSRELLSMKEEEWLPLSKGWQCTLLDREDPKEYAEECFCAWELCNKKYPPCKDRKIKNGKFCTR